MNAFSMLMSFVAGSLATLAGFSVASNMYNEFHKTNGSENEKE